MALADVVSDRQLASNQQIDEQYDRTVREDIELLALTGAQHEPYAALKLSELDRTERPRRSPAELSESLRHYLYAKYVYRAAGNGNGNGDGNRAETSREASRLALAVDPLLA